MFRYSSPRRMPTGGPVIVGGIASDVREVVGVRPLTCWLARDLQCAQRALAASSRHLSGSTCTFDAATN
jgi:hypothetical protein